MEEQKFNDSSQPALQQADVSRRALSIKDFKDGFKYEAWVGYEWVEVEVGKNGFSKSQLKDAIERGLVRSLHGG